MQFKPHPSRDRDRTVIRLPSFEKVRNDAVLYAHANRVLHLETNPGNARALVQKHGERGPLGECTADPPVHPGNGLRLWHAFRPRAAPFLSAMQKYPPTR